MSGCLVPRNTAPNIAWPCCTQGRQAQSPRAAHEAVATESSSPQQEAGAVDELAAEVDLASLLRQTPCTLAGEAAGCTTLTLRLAYLLLCGVGRKQIQVEVGRPYGNANRGKDRRYSGWLAQGTQSWSWECSAACTSASAFTQVRVAVCGKQAAPGLAAPQARRALLRALALLLSCSHSRNAGPTERLPRAGPWVSTICI